MFFKVLELTPNDASCIMHSDAFPIFLFFALQSQNLIHSNVSLIHIFSEENIWTKVDHHLPKVMVRYRTP